MSYLFAGVTVVVAHSGEVEPSPLDTSCADVNDGDVYQCIGSGSGGCKMFQN